MAQSRRTSIGLRSAMAVAGLFTLAFYAVTAYGLYLVAEFVWANRPDLFTIIWIFLAATLASGYLTYRFGTGRTLRGLDARELPRSRAPIVHELVDSLASSMDVDRPRVYVARLGEPNALALAGKTPALVVDFSLFRLLDAAELEGVLAHEFAHVEGRDGLFQVLGYSLVQTVVGLVALAFAPAAVLAGGFARGLALVRGRPEGWHRTVPGKIRIAISQVLTLLLVAMTVFLRTYSRRREHAADDRAVEVTGRPLALARALKKIDGASSSPFPFAPLYRRENGDEHPLARLLSTHPPVADRIERLRDRAEATDSSGRDSTDAHRGRTGGDQRRGRTRRSGRTARTGPTARSENDVRPGHPNRGDDGWTRIPIEEE